MFVCITGPMFSGKTDKLVRILSSLKMSKTVCFKPEKDTRNREEKIVSRTGLSYPAMTIQNSHQIIEALSKLDVTTIGIDEAQLFEYELFDTVVHLLEEGYTVVVAGLFLDYKCKPFGPMEELVALAAEYDNGIMQYELANCTICGDLAAYTFKKPNTPTGQVVIGDKDIYEARCVKHYVSTI